eukprot:5404402-Pyramimonas_sp.AAC.1
MINAWALEQLAIELFGSLSETLAVEDLRLVLHMDFGRRAGRDVHSTVLLQLCNPLRVLRGV